jgi:hypothetical protein
MHWKTPILAQLGSNDSPKEFVVKGQMVFIELLEPLFLYRALVDLLSAFPRVAASRYGAVGDLRTPGPIVP